METPASNDQAPAKVLCAFRLASFLYRLLLEALEALESVTDLARFRYVAVAGGTAHMKR